MRQIPLGVDPEALGKYVGGGGVGHPGVVVFVSGIVLYIRFL